jgi:NAD(P)-dependent dehydrogenase (short-subunit alcohol dehydrogenase family)
MTHRRGVTREAGEKDMTKAAIVTAAGQGIAAACARALAEAG